MRHPTTDGWCILRTSGRNTLRLAETLAAQGYDAWTPKGPPEPKQPDETAKRAPRSRSRRKAEEAMDLVPILPTFIFAPARHLEDLAELSRREEFSVMCDRVWHRGYMLVADASLDHMRAYEARAMKRLPPPPAEPFEEGQIVKVPIAIMGFASMSGMVESSDHKKTWINFGGVMGRVQVETFRLRPDEEKKAA